MASSGFKRVQSMVKHRVVSKAISKRVVLRVLLLGWFHRTRNICSLALYSHSNRCLSSEIRMVLGKVKDCMSVRLRYGFRSGKPDGGRWWSNTGKSKS